MSFIQFFDNLSHDINSSRAARNAAREAIRAHIQEIRSDVENFRDNFRSKHKQMATALKREANDLRKKLKGHSKARVKAAHKLMGELRTQHGGIVALTRSMLHELADDLRRGGEIFRGNGTTASPKESRKKKR